MEPSDPRGEDGKAGAEEVGIFLLCIIDYEHTQSTKAGAPGVDPGQLITESRLFPQRQTDVATDAPRRDREVNADRVLFVGERRLKRSWYRGIVPACEEGERGRRSSTDRCPLTCLVHTSTRHRQTACAFSHAPLPPVFR